MREVWEGVLDNKKKYIRFIGSYDFQHCQIQFKIF
jgi:hypothetical protein